MAEAGAHLTAAADERPSVFELLAQESLMEAVRPALRHAAKVLAESHPSQFGFLWRRFDEVYLLLDFLLQNHFLSRRSASFSENFYGLKRVSSSGSGSGSGSDGTWRRRSLLLLCLAPYLRARLEAALARQRDEDDFSIRLAGGRGRRLGRAAAAAYPLLSSAGRAWAFCHRLLYVFGLAASHNPLLWLAGVRLARLTAEDIRDMELKTPRTGNPADSSLARRAWRLASGAAGGVAASLSTSLSLGVFFLQFLEFWFSSDNRSAVRTLTSPPAPPPPLHLRERRAPGGSGGTCPLCRRPRTNAAALCTSGFVFCYRCIYVYVKDKQRCPITGFPSQLQHLVKIYAPDS
ncbi:peroxisome assembly protein 12 [Centroberyx affinis]|uniref:peroxisome assembly protein 12 n=1 Tax=Centroberyx affinis TaxID=166261 RepID=UPI003A5BA3B5